MSTFDDKIADTTMLNVLIIEDNDTDYLLMQRYIGKLWPASVCVRAATRAEVVAVLLLQWDLIITDYHLIDIEGDELISTISEKQSLTPCLILSGSIDELRQIDVPANIFCRLEKGDYSGLMAALKGDWQAVRS